MHRLPVKCKTKSGLEFCAYIDSEYMRPEKQSFLAMTTRELNRARRLLDNFLDDEKTHKLNEQDKKGWNIFWNLDDRFAVLNHYNKRAQYENQV